MRNLAQPQRLPSLPPALRSPLAVAAVLAAMVVAALWVLYAGQSAAGAFDRWAQPPLDRSGGAALGFALVIDFCGEPVGLTALVVLLAVSCWLLGNRRMAVLAVAGPVLTITVTTVIKPLAHRTIHGGFLSFPSGHTASATAMAFVLALLIVQRRRPGRLAGSFLVLGTATVAGGFAGWAQAGLTAHYPTDTIAGYCTALAVVSAAAWLLDRFTVRAESPPEAGSPARRATTM